ncbi:MFS transporter [Helicobacter sp. MIT 14-3879]|uniref:MFS transporter n=1 Tax=Helicobacter sp. MIT 14-3879 TaxID=2040649 RepID=UPI000E1F5FE0|nr:MFS transporter [Helicobacter sp. MIT 14-3879]RDU62905.1 MFS transporter [Helicobacter sp. MIT 14-3879]
MFKVVGSLSLIAGFRFFGLFVVMPTLALYAKSLGANNTMVIGFAISSYAISQIIFQVPFGILGDRYSKRNIIAFGLIIFAIGSFICAFANNIETIILGRIIQGAGAIGSVVSAKITDLISEENRGKAMAFMGISIFVSFILAMVIGPSFGVIFGVDKLFLLTAILSLLAIIPLYTIVPKAPHLKYEVLNDKKRYLVIFSNKNLTILNISVMIQKFLMTFAFTIIPITLVHHLGMNEKDIWKVFSISALFGIIAILPSMIISEKYKHPKEVLLVAIVIFAIAYLSMGLGDLDKMLILYTIGVVLFFCAFCMHEPILQNLASKYPKMQDKSLSLGIFTTFGYFGSFFGGIIGGFIFNKIDFIYIAIVIFIFMLIWFILLLFLQNPRLYENIYIKLDSNIKEIKEINNIFGVIESYINNNMLVIKFDNTKIDVNELRRLIIKDFIL